MLYLEDDDAVAAEQYIKKASSLLAACKVGPRCCTGKAPSLLAACEVGPRCGRRGEGGRGPADAPHLHSNGAQRVAACEVGLALHHAEALGAAGFGAGLHGPVGSNRALL